MAFEAHIKIEGLTELQHSLKASQGKLPAALGSAHKAIGQYIIAKVPPGDPHAVGAGSGSVIRPSATKRDVVIRVGGTHRSRHVQQWGKKYVHPPTKGRPYILGTVLEHEDDIVEQYHKTLIMYLRPYFPTVK